ncbi:hypothetical protein BSKO_09599 [Bryopsis sp. KO-2023]|nr:hypothetical protein BSKO_09599 [Bryopsis sp. KO-2023]
MGFLTRVNALGGLVWDAYNGSNDLLDLQMVSTAEVEQARERIRLLEGELAEIKEERIGVLELELERERIDSAGIKEANRALKDQMAALKESLNRKALSLVEKADQLLAQKDQLEEERSNLEAEKVEMEVMKVELAAQSAEKLEARIDNLMNELGVPKAAGQTSEIVDEVPDVEQKPGYWKGLEKRWSDVLNGTMLQEEIQKLQDESEKIKKDATERKEEHQAELQKLEGIAKEWAEFSLPSNTDLEAKMLAVEVSVEEAMKKMNLVVNCDSSVTQGIPIFFIEMPKVNLDDLKDVDPTFDHVMEDGAAHVNEGNSGMISILERNIKELSDKQQDFESQTEELKEMVKEREQLLETEEKELDQMKKTNESMEEEFKNIMEARGKELILKWEQSKEMQVDKNKSSADQPPKMDSQPVNLQKYHSRWIENFSDRVNDYEVQVFGQRLFEHKAFNHALGWIAYHEACKQIHCDGPIKDNDASCALLFFLYQFWRKQDSPFGKKKYEEAADDELLFEENDWGTQECNWSWTDPWPEKLPQYLNQAEKNAEGLEPWLGEEVAGVNHGSLTGEGDSVDKWP